MEIDRTVSDRIVAH